MLFLFAIGLVVLSIKYENNPFWNIVPLMISITLFFVLSISIYELTIPYQLYNGTGIETGLHEIHLVENIFIGYLLSGMAVLLMIYFIAMIYDKWINFKP